LEELRKGNPDLDIDKIRDHIAKREFKITDHAFEEMKADNLSFCDIINVITSGAIIENYPAAYPLPACLINGNAGNGEPVHVCVSLPPLVKVITVYRPDIAKWTNDFKKRRLR